MPKVEIYDTTLRDGTQAEDFNLQLEDKLKIAKKLDELGVHYIEGGWPSSNPKDELFFKEVRGYAFKNAQIAAFGSTHHPQNTPENDSNLNALLNAKTEVVTIFGKSWDLHVKDALKISLEKNLNVIYDSLAYLRPYVKKLFYDAEHFFDGFKNNPEYALATIKKAIEAGADCIIFCDTNGGTLPFELPEIFEQVKKACPNIRFGIHAHNDAEVAVANSLMAVRLGAIQVQGTLNGVGERCGNANLCSIIPALKLKMGIDCIDDENLVKLTATSRFVTELINIAHPSYLPYVGRSAFAHKGGVHVSAVKRNPHTYEHIPPEKVGNTRRILISDLSGKSTILTKAKEWGIDFDSADPQVKSILQELKDLENQGFQFDVAEESFKLRMYRAKGELRKEYFKLFTYRVRDYKTLDGWPIAEAEVWIAVDGQEKHAMALGQGPVNALDKALRKALEDFYPSLKEMSLVDYRVRVLPGTTGTEARVRVLIESKDKECVWRTVGVSYDILEASLQALIDSIIYKLFREDRNRAEC
ncbi:MAG TPA: citramalate synthase [Thermoplasmatales archaeon]|nr:citramalate synthase [Thermoplasmatales archaeon]